MDAYQLIKLKVKALGTDSITRDTVRSNNAKVWRDWLNRFASTSFVPKALREFRFTTEVGKARGCLSVSAQSSVNCALNKSVAKLKTDVERRRLKSVKGGLINLLIIKLVAARAHKE